MLSCAVEKLTPVRPQPEVNQTTAVRIRAQGRETAAPLTVVGPAEGRV